MDAERINEMVEFKHNMPWPDDKQKTELMLLFESETGKNAIYKDKITGLFHSWQYKKLAREFKKGEITKTIKKKVKKTITKHEIKPIQSRIKIKTPPESICYEKRRRGTTKNPVIEHIPLNSHTVHYNWTEGQLYVDSKPIGPKDAKFCRDLLTFAKQNKPHTDRDYMQQFMIANYDEAVKKGWDNYANTVKDFAREFNIAV